MTLIETVECIQKPKSKLLKFIIKWLLRYKSMNFLIFGDGPHAQVGPLARKLR